MFDHVGFNVLRFRPEQGFFISRPALQPLGMQLMRETEKNSR